MNKQTQKNLLNIVDKNYNEIAKEFNETRKKELWQELINLTKNIKDGNKVLDVGCGNGRIIDALIDRKIEYLGVDQSKELISFARENYRDTPWAKFEFGRIQELNQVKGVNFDFVFSIAVLHHIPGENMQIEALRQLKNKVKKEGRIVVSAWNLWNKPKYRKLIFKFALLKLIRKNKMDFGDILFDWYDYKKKSLSKRYYHAFTKRSLKRIAKKAGLVIDRVYKDRYNYYIVLKWK